MIFRFCNPFVSVKNNDPARFVRCLAAALAQRRVGLCGGAQACGISADNRYFVEVFQTHDTPPATRLVDATSATHGLESSGIVRLGAPGRGPSPRDGSAPDRS